MGVYRMSQATLVAAFVMLGGAVVAFAAHARTAGIILLVLMLACGMVSFGYSVIFRNRAVALAREARRQQQANRAASVRPSRSADES